MLIYSLTLGLNAGRNQEGTYLPLKDELLRSQIEQVREKIANFKKISEKRYAEAKTSGAGTEIDQKYDRVYADFIEQADRVESMLQQQISKELTTFQLLQTFLIAVCFLLSVVIGLIIFRYISRHTKLKALHVFKDTVYSGRKFDLVCMDPYDAGMDTSQFKWELRMIELLEGRLEDSEVEIVLTSSLVDLEDILINFSKNHSIFEQNDGKIYHDETDNAVTRAA